MVERAFICWYNRVGVEYKALCRCEQGGHDANLTDNGARMMNDIRGIG